MTRTHRFTCIVLAVLTGLLLLGVADIAGAAPAGYMQDITHAITASQDGAVSSAVMTLYVYNTSGTNGNNVLYVGANCQADFDDILINDSTDTVTFPHWINWSESDANHIVLYYNITSGVPLGGTTIRIYYSNPAATNHENLSGVFTVYDHFDDADYTGWTITRPAGISQSGSSIVISYAAAGGLCSIKSNITYGPTGFETIIVGSLDPGHVSDFDITTTGGGYARFGGDWPTAGQVAAYTERTGSAYTNLGALSGNHTWIMRYVSGNLTWVYDGTQVYQYTTTANMPNLSTAVRAQVEESGAVITVDLIIVKPYYTNPPTDGAWGTANSDILQTIPYTLYKIDLFGLSFGPVQGASVTVMDINGNTYRTGTTGTDGVAAFQLYRNTYYNINFVKSSDGIDKTWSGYPADINGYMVYIYPWEFSWTNQSNGSSDVNTAINTFITVESNGTAGDITAYYNDTSGTTSTATINIYQRNNATNETLLATYTEAGNSNFSRLFTMEDVSGQDYKVVITASSSKYGDITRSYPWRFPGPKYPVAGLPAMAYTWIGFIIPTFTALTASYRNLKFAPLIFCIMSWIFVMIGWMDQMGVLYELGLAVATVFAVIFIFKIKQGEGY